MKALVERHKEAPFAIVGVNTDEDKDEYRKNITEFGVTWKSAWQGGGRGPIPRTWGVTGYPTIFVLDAKGVIRYRDARGEALDRAVETLLAELEQAKTP